MSGAPASGMIIADPEALARRRADLQAGLTSALRAGEATQAIRADMRAIDEEIAREAAAEKGRSEDEQREHQRDVDELGLKFAEQDEAEIVALLQSLAAPITSRSVSLESKAVLQAAALRVAGATMELHALRGQAGQPGAELQVLRDEIARKQAMRAEMIKRRQDGKLLKDDDAVAHALTLDIEGPGGLNDLAHKAEAQMAARNPAVRTSQAAVAMAEADRVSTRGVVLLEIVSEYLQDVAGALVQIAELQAGLMKQTGLRQTCQMPVDLERMLLTAAAAVRKVAAPTTMLRWTGQPDWGPGGRPAAPVAVQRPAEAPGRDQMV